MKHTAEVVRVFAPATVANLGPGFDVLGLALEGPGDVVSARLIAPTGTGASARRQVTIVSVSGAELPLDAALNTAGIAARATLERAGVDACIELEVAKGLPIGSGLGSSAASAAAAACAVNLLLGAPLRKVQLLEPCIEAEAAVAGRHADNVGPALLGGLVLIRSVEPLDLVRLPVPAGLLVVTVTPRFELPTREARAVLPERVPLASMVHNTAQLAAFVSACYSGDLGLLGRAIDDAVVTPARIGLIPGGAEALRVGREAGALGVSISGAGPTLFALCHSRTTASRVALAMVEQFERAGIEAEPRISAADCPGARRL